MARKIFINYRRGDDPGFTLALYQQLESELPGADLFMDVEGKIMPGDDFVAVLTAEVAACDVLLAVIGPRWSELLAVRAGDPGDFVAIEIEAALDRGKRVIPVLVGGATMPRAESLPGPILALARMHAVSLRPDRFKADCQGLATAVKEHLAAVERERDARVEAKRNVAEAEQRRGRTAETAPARAKPLRWQHGAVGGTLALLGFSIYWLIGIVPPQPAVPLTAAVPLTVAVPLTAAEERTLKPKDSFKECDVCPEMVAVPAGSFTMGAPWGEKESDNDEGPPHTVTIARPFAVGRFEVTFAEWDACVAEGGCRHTPHDGVSGQTGWGRGKRPVINVSWDDITKAYLPWLSRKTGTAYRLLTEAEWEYVARAGTTTPFWWGSSISTSQANYNGLYTYRNSKKGAYRAETLPADSLAPNPWGLHNVHGNVWEWAQDCWNDGYTNAPSDGSARTARNCTAWVLRGGSWNLEPGSLRSANRGSNSAGVRTSTIGFRIARTL